MASDLIRFLPRAILSHQNEDPMQRSTALPPMRSSSVHAAYVAVVVGGLVLMLAGAVRGWRWTRNFWFRIVHFLMIAVVAGESLLGIVCPLTRWENQLRAAGGEGELPGSFVGRLMHAVLFYEFPEWVLHGHLRVCSRWPCWRPWFGPRPSGRDSSAAAAKDRATINRGLSQFSPQRKWDCPPRSREVVLRPVLNGSFRRYGVT